MLASAALTLAAGAALRPAPAAAQTVPMADLMAASALKDIVQGDANAPVVMIEYASMTCGHCAAFHNTVYPELKKRYIDTGRMRYILREFPLDPLAAGAFMLARCAGDERHYGVVDVLFNQFDTWTRSRNPVEALFAIAQQVGFTRESYETCLKDQALLDKITEVRQRGSEKFGVNSTPTFFINGTIKRGGGPLEEFTRIIDPLLKS
jgi:protein-disulfide isomerase